MSGDGRVRHGLRVATRGGVARLQLARPGADNRIDQPLAQALCDAVAAIELDDGINVVVLSAEGRHFCRGVEAGGAWERQVDWIAAVGRLTRPVMAVIDGDAIAEGMELALACDLRVVSERARFALPQIGEGRLPAHGGTQRLPRLVGRMRALDLVLSGRVVGPREAEAIGLASRRAPRRQLSRVATAVVGELQTKGPLALRYAKEAVLKGSDMTLDQGIRLEEDLYVLLQSTADRAEGVAAFRQKRRPVFRGR